MARVEKFTEHAVVNQLRHNLRQIKYSTNVDIDMSRADQNYELGPDRNMTAYDYFKERKQELYCYRRADVKVMAGWVVTAPKDLARNLHERFFEETYHFLEQRYGQENVIQAIVHNDESGQPHLHFDFIPVAPDEKHQCEKICANDVLNRKELRNFHPDLQNHLKEHGINARVMTGITREQGRNRTVKELKQEREHQRQTERKLRF